MGNDYVYWDGRRVIEADYITADQVTYTDTYWDDLRVPLTTAKLAGAGNPGYAKFQDDGAGSTGINLYSFDDTVEEYLMFIAQLPHKYKLGTDIKAHVHWSPSAAGGADKVVAWGLEYEIQQIGGTYSGTTIIGGNTHTPADNPLVQDKHYLTPLGTISGVAITSVSACIIGRVFRDATGALNTDDFVGDAWGVEIDFHYEVDSPGSRQEYTK
jgi:hypothetical protein